MSSLGEVYPVEQARVRTVLGHYKEIGVPGKIGALLIEDLLLRADKAVAEGDVIAMLGCYEEMKATQ